jgi:hypothetical protein
VKAATIGIRTLVHYSVWLKDRQQSLGIVWCTVYLFVCIACFQLLSLGFKDFENLQELVIQDFEQQQAGEQGE